MSNKIVLCPSCKHPNAFRFSKEKGVEFALSIGGDKTDWFQIREDAKHSTCNKCYMPIEIPKEFIADDRLPDTGVEV